MLPYDVRTGICGPAVHVQGNVEEALQVLHRLSATAGQVSQSSVTALFNSSNRAIRHGTLHRYGTCFAEQYLHR
jgi:hypothetical protein